MTLAMSPTSPAELTLRVSESLATDADFVGIRASVESRGFAGLTSFTISRRDLQRFLVDATAVRDDAADLAVLLGGWHDREEFLRLEIVRTRAAGGLVVRVRMATPGFRADHWSRVDTEFVADRGGLAAFVDELARFAGPDGTTSVSLRGMAESIV